MLKKNVDKWEFESEEDLENFVWENLPILYFNPDVSALGTDN